MRDERFAQRCSSEAGTVMIFVAAGMLAILLFLALALDQGVRYSGRTQLQQLVDAASQAALAALAQPEAERSEADAAAREIARMTPVSQGFDATRDLNVQFGRYDFATQTFVAEGMPVGPPAAVRVSANKTGASALQSLLTGAPISANADSIAALRCRNVVFVQDVSSSFRDDIGNIQAALTRTVELLRREESAGIETRVGLVAFRNIVVDKATTDSLVPPSSAAIIDAIAALDDDDVLCKGSIRPVSTFPLRFEVPACVGSDMRDGLEEAEDLLEPGNGKIPACEDFVLTISDGVPCKVTPENVDQFPFAEVFFGPALPGEPQGGGATRQETLDYVNSDMRDSGSIAVLTANSDEPENLEFNGIPTQQELDAFLKTCPTDRASTSQQQFNQEFARQLITGFGQSFESKVSAEDMAAEMRAALRSIPPVVVR